jgi:hypothetical protein
MWLASRRLPTPALGSIQSPPFLNSALDGGEPVSLITLSLYTRGKMPESLFYRMYPTADLDIMEKRKILWLS